jgi:hypothetical protein
MTQNPLRNIKETHDEREYKQQERNYHQYTLGDINIINNVNLLQLKDLVIRKETKKKTAIRNQNNKRQIKKTK